MNRAPTTDVTALLASGERIQLTEFGQACGVQKSMVYTLLKDVEKVIGAELPKDEQGKRMYTSMLLDLVVTAREKAAQDKTISFETAVRHLLTDNGFEPPALPMTPDELNAAWLVHQQQYRQDLDVLNARLSRVEDDQFETGKQVLELLEFRARIEQMIAEPESDPEVDEEETLGEEAHEETAEPVPLIVEVLGRFIVICERPANTVKALIRRLRS